MMRSGPPLTLRLSTDEGEPEGPLAVESRLETAAPGRPQAAPRTPQSEAVSTGPARSALDLLFLQEATKLVYRLFLTPGQAALSSVLFCGIDRASNSSAICSKSGEILATQVDKTVCVVDTNAQTPSVHERFGIENGPGFADALRQRGPLRPFTRQLAPKNLWVMTAGSVVGDQVLAASDQLRTRMLELRTLFDYVLLDSPPAALSIDPMVLGQWVDGAVLVIESNLTKRETALQAKTALQAANVRILGAVLLQGRPSAAPR